MTPDQPQPSQGDIGPYRLDVLLGRGGMGEVYKAWDRRLERWVAVKRLLARQSTRGNGTDKIRRRFLREARILAGLGHPAIVQVHDILEEEDDWIVMELVDGPDLATLLRDGPLLPRLAADYGRQVAEGLAAAHKVGVIHRDLKTENVMVDERIRILDFGLARRPHEFIESEVGKVAGTPRAMAPEQALGRHLDARADLFALGVLLYELLTARSPFRADTTAATLKRVVTHKQPPVRQLNPRVPEALSTLVDALLEKDPSHRPPSALDVAAELSKLDEHGYVPPETLVDSLDDPTAVDDTTIAARPAVEAPTLEAQLRTLLVSDLVDSTRRVETLGDKNAAKLFQRHDRLARDLLAEFNGMEIDKTDGFLLLFERPWNAVRYALAYHEALLGLELPARVGIHLGEVLLFHNTPDDVARGAKPVEVEGLAKPTTARLMSLAAGGQTLMTRAAFDVARRAAVDDENDALRWLEHGTYRFKGVADDVDVFEVGVDGVAPLTAPPGSAKAQRIDEAPAGSAGILPARGRSPALRVWPPPDLPEQPYPVLLPYTHPDLMAGRDHNLAAVRLRLELPIPILGLGAPSGTGKSSFLLGGLVPRLRAEGKPVAVVRHPREPGVTERLLGDLFEDVHDVTASQHGPGIGPGLKPGAERLPSLRDSGIRSLGGAVGTQPRVSARGAPRGAPRDFADRLAEVERLSGETPLLVIDQFEDVLREDATAARARLGVLLATTAERRPGIDAPLCRWLLAYRNEYHGEVLAWLEDVLVDAPDDLALPHDLADPERSQSFALPPLATVKAAAPSLENVTAVFQAAIEKPLRHYDLAFAPGHAERLARAFAASRLARPEAPLAPELQVVLAHILANSDGELQVPENADALVEEALGDHLRRALESAFPTGTASSASANAGVRRARALLALRELATATGQRDEGVRADDLVRAIGEDGEDILQGLATPLTRLIVLRDAPDGLRYVLSHDQMAAVVVRMVEEEGRHGKLLVDAELLALRRFVALKTALHRSQESATLATRIPRRHFRGIRAHAEALLWDNERRAWWADCQRQRRADLRRTTLTAAAALFFLVVVGGTTWKWVKERELHQALLATVAEGKPDAAFAALNRLTDVSDAELLELLRQRDVPMDVLESGLGGIPDEQQRNTAVLRTVALALPWVVADPENFVLISNLVWALDYGPGRDPVTAAEALDLRDKVLEPLRQIRPPPPIAADDPDWIEIPAGMFLMGSPEGEGYAKEHPQHEVTVSAFRMLRHEVTNAEYRRLVPDHPGEDDLPAAYLNWYAAITYAAWLGGRLPTEAEWEYAARAGCPYAYCMRDGQEATVDDVAWTHRNSRDRETGELAPSPVMSLEPDPWGLYDMLGNLWEWTADWYVAYPDGRSTDPWGPAAASGGRRVLRGGSCWGVAGGSRVASRDRFAPGNGDEDQGCRVVLPVAPSSG